MQENKILQSLRFADLVTMQKDVIHWNQVAGNSLTGEGQIEKYNYFVISEFLEFEKSLALIDADVNSVEGRREWVDGICDILVTGFWLDACMSAQGVALTPELIEKYQGEDAKNYKELNDDARFVLANIAFTTLIENVMNPFAVTQLVPAFAEVMESNWSKFLRVDKFPGRSELERVIDSSTKALLESGKAKEVTTVERDGYVILLNENGKIMKPTTFNEPRNLERFFLDDREIQG